MVFSGSHKTTLWRFQLDTNEQLSFLSIHQISCFISAPFRFDDKSIFCAILKHFLFIHARPASWLRAQQSANIWSCTSINFCFFFTFPNQTSLSNFFQCALTYQRLIKLIENKNNIEKRSALMMSNERNVKRVWKKFNLFPCEMYAN